MESYVRKLHKHDITHEVSVQSYYVWTYFKSNSTMAFFNVNAPHRTYSVIINNVTDPRFGGDFKSIYRNESPRIGDFLVITKVAGGRFSLELVKQGTKRYLEIQAKFDCNNRVDRHALINL